MDAQWYAEAASACPPLEITYKAIPLMFVGLCRDMLNIDYSYNRIKFFKSNLNRTMATSSVHDHQNANNNIKYRNNLALKERPEQLDLYGFRMRYRGRRQLVFVTFNGKLAVNSGPPSLLTAIRGSFL